MTRTRTKRAREALCQVNASLLEVKAMKDDLEPRIMHYIEERNSFVWHVRVLAYGEVVVAS
ncbi:unnamed protein product [Lupinus luteus]|uniref:Uncharacterized protein n=1 Tax=Lupinus luteus TaxID=3873 RepID=A0AAV1W853_LUPLU